jgi:ubiquinone/menaquinone biosynthesis C-methylase UbiE
VADHDTELTQDNVHFFEQHDVSVEDFPSSGFVLDIGGGGEGIIGLLKGQAVVAIDFLAEELAEAADGPLKVVMDARDLQFLDETFGAATAFFSLMYFKNRADYERVFSEVYRVLKPGGQFLVWDVIVERPPDVDQEIYVIPLLVRVSGREIETGYGQRWPEEVHDVSFYVGLAEGSGLRLVGQEERGRVFFLRFEKPAS